MSQATATPSINSAKTVDIYVNGGFRQSAATETVPVTNPANQAVIAYAPLTTMAEVGEAVAAAQAAGAQVVTGGHKLNMPGFFMEPTVVSDVTPDMENAQEEVFGPVVSVLKFRDEAEAIRIANGTKYGLVAGVFTRDLNRATHAARHLRAGQVFVNEWFAGGVETPFGGYGKSGYGREKGKEALLNYVQTKNVAIKLG